MVIISRYLEKYKGTYRVKAFHDLRKNDYPRVLKDGRMVIDPSFDDIYIPCKSNIYIMHYQGSVLFCIIPSIGKGHNIIKSIYDKRYGLDTSNGISYDDLYSKLINDNIVLKIEETDKEIIIYFNDNMMNYFEDIFKPRTSGKNISVFSTKNLEKSDYEIPQEDIDKYKSIISKFKNMIEIKKVNDEFTKKYNIQDIKKSGLNTKQYIHSVGDWDEYLKFLE